MSPSNLNPLIVVWAFLEERVKTNANSLHSSPLPALPCCCIHGDQKLRRKERKERNDGVFSTVSTAWEPPHHGGATCAEKIPQLIPSARADVEAGRKAHQRAVFLATGAGVLSPPMLLQRWNTAPPQPPCPRDLLPGTAQAALSRM